MYTAIIPVVLLTAPGADPALEHWASKAQIGDPWLSNRRSNFRNIKEIVASAVNTGMSDGENAMAL